MKKILKSIAVVAAPLLAAGCVAYPYYDDPYYGGGYAGYAYAAPPPVTYAPSVTYYYDYEYSPPRKYYYRDGHRHYQHDYQRSDDRGRYWRDRDHRYYDGR